MGERGSRKNYPLPSSRGSSKILRGSKWNLEFE
nr:MAG TPA: hypothetical protein [Caudoviricetes sp.]